MKGEGLVLSTAYFATIRYFSVLLSDATVCYIERHENYVKQSYRNRCTIYSANGLLDLVVPVAKSVKPKIPVAEVEISYDMTWQKQHFKAIESAYRRSPFYEFYIDDLMLFFNCRHRYLYDYNMHILRTICTMINIPFRVQESQTYISTTDACIDYRNIIHPKVVQQHLDIFPQYTQVFSEKWGFKPNLSILDLLFNMGPESKNYIKNIVSPLF